MVSKLRHFLTSLSEDHLLKLKKKNTIFGFLGLSKQTLLLSKIIIPKTIQYIKFVVAVYFYYDEDLMLLFLGLFRQKKCLYVGVDPALSKSHACKEFVQFLVISNRHLQLSRYYSVFVVSCSVFVANYAERIEMHQSKTEWLCKMVIFLAA